MFLTRARRFFSQKGVLKSTLFSYDQIDFLDHAVRWQGEEARYVVFCQGAQLQDNPFFKSLSFRPSCGDVLTLSSDSLPDTFNLSFEKWLVPIGQHRFKFGATFDWEPFDMKNRARFCQLLLDYLKDYVCADVTVLSSHVARRCALQDGKPLCGRHPSLSSVCLSLIHI